MRTAPLSAIARANIFLRRKTAVKSLKTQARMEEFFRDSMENNRASMLQTSHAALPVWTLQVGSVA
jgi:hypothetical protein